jgi:drug/metabolite transporter (DMT)-like permease
MMDYPTDFQNSEENKWLYIRNVPMVIHAFSIALVQFILPLPLVHTICSAGNLFVFLFDFWLYGVKITRKQAAGILLGFVGVLAIILGRPITHWLFKDLEGHTDFQNYLTDDPIIIGIVTALFTGELAIWALGVVVIKRLKHSNAIQINYHQGIIIVISCGLTYPFYESKTSLTEIITCFLINILPVLGGQSLFIAALTMSKNLGMITMITFTCVIVSYLLSIFRYHETQNIICTCGVVLVVVGLARALFYK